MNTFHAVRNEKSSLMMISIDNISRGHWTRNSYTVQHNFTIHQLNALFVSTTKTTSQVFSLNIELKVCMAATYPER